MITLEKSLSFSDSENFQQVFRDEVCQLDKHLLPLQQGLKQGSHVSDSPIDVVVMSAQHFDDKIIVKTSIFYNSIIAGSCCADDPTPLDELTENCELEFVIDKDTAETNIKLL